MNEHRAFILSICSTAPGHYITSYLQKPIGRSDWLPPHTQASAQLSVSQDARGFENNQWSDSKSSITVWICWSLDPVCISRGEPSGCCSANRRDVWSICLLWALQMNFLQFPTWGYHGNQSFYTAKKVIHLGHDVTHKRRAQTCEMCICVFEMCSSTSSNVLI